MFFPRISRALIAAGLGLATVALAAGPASATRTTAPRIDTPVLGSLPVIKHVWTIVLENSDEAETLAEDAPTGNGELTMTLRSQGVFIPNYFATGHSSLDNYIALAAAQGPTVQTQGDCNDDNNPIGGNKQTATFNSDGQALASAADIAANRNLCTYPANVPTLATQLTAAGYTWRTYAQGMDDAPQAADSNNPALRTTCQSAQYAGDTNSTAANPTSTAGLAVPRNYARKHDPELYFYGVTGIGGTKPSALCDADEVGIGRLKTDLSHEATTPSYSLIVPDLCNDAHDGTCKSNSVGPDDRTPATTSGIPQADQFLEAYVPAILDSAAYKDGGMLMITFDEGSEALACCGEVTSPNLPAGTDNGGTAISSTTPGAVTYDRGGGQIGMVAISPYILPGSVSPVPYNHYSYVRSMENLFRLTPDRTGIAGSDGQGHIGYAGSQGGSAANAPAAFGSDVYSNPTGQIVSAALPDSRLAVLLPIAALLIGAGLLSRRWRTA